MKINANRKDQMPYTESFAYYCSQLSQCHVDMIEISGNAFSKFPKDESAYFLPQAKTAKQVSGIPVILTGGMHEAELMEQILHQGIDMIGTARPFICEPDFAERIRNGQKKSKCVHCWQCFKLYNTKFKNCVFLPEDEQLEKIFG